MNQKVTKSDDEWKAKLTPEQYEILRKKGTEAPYMGKLYMHKEKGTYLCAGCGNELFSSDTKYESGSGWPSFYSPVGETNVNQKTDGSRGMHRTEVTCSNCDGHLGHVFDDGPQDKTGKRFCINSASLEFKKDD